MPHSTYGANIDPRDETGFTAAHYALLGQEERGRYQHELKRKECRSKRKIDALELLGASIALSENALEGFSYLKRGMEERFNDPALPVLKQAVSPVKAYQSK